MIRVYEEYTSKQEKRAAQRGAQRMRPTGKARGYMLVVRDGGYLSGIGNVYGNPDVGEPPNSLASCCPSFDYLRERCRAVGFRHIPQEWQQAFKRWLD